ncbi:MAG TPA: MarC family protein [Phycisphaerae bacterium]|nr:MarC family protein [Phycisphaerae bacterium]
MSIYSAAITLFLMMDPIGNVPAFAALLKDVDARRRSVVVVRENVIALGVLLFFLLFGPSVMGLLHIEEAALSVAGGVVLFIVALEMIFPGRRAVHSDPASSGEPFIVPMAIPLIAGPSTMAVLMLMASREPARRPEWTAALLIAWSAGLIVLLLADRLRPLMGARGLAVIERLMGMVLLVMAVQMSMSGLRGFWHSVAPATAPALAWM